MVESLPSKHEALSSNPSTKKKKKPAILKKKNATCDYNPTCLGK
jgi:hypothetical protein